MLVVPRLSCRLKIKISTQFLVKIDKLIMSLIMELQRPMGGKEDLPEGKE